MIQDMGKRLTVYVATSWRGPRAGREEGGGGHVSPAWQCVWGLSDDTGGAGPGGVHWSGALWACAALPVIARLRRADV